MALPNERLNQNQHVEITLVRLAVLVVNALLAVREGSVEHNDTESTLQDLLSFENLPQRAPIKVKQLANLMYLANMREEATGEFWSPTDGETFERFLARTLRYIRPGGRVLKFDREYNTLEYKEASDGAGK